MRPVLAAAPPGPLGVAVSGGGDSTALLLLLRSWAAATGRATAAVTVDHGLRAESAAEAASVAALCARLGIAHEILRWTRPDRGNLQAMARDGRRALIAEWATARGMGAVALGHTLDDQAETLLIRLGRGSGVDGLAAMAPVSEANGLRWLRPLLAVRRATLREWLRAEGVAWSEDPSNDDPAFARVRARRALAVLGPLGVTPERLAATAARMRRAREALEAATRALAAETVTEGAAGDVLLDRGPFAAAPEEVGLRLLAAVLMWVSGARYRPRSDALAPAYDAVVRGMVGRGLTLHGCVLRGAGDAVAVRREPGRVAGPVPASAERWDGRWLLVATGGETLAGLEIGALGADDLPACGDWRARGLAREALLSSPALRRDGALVAAPVAAGTGPWRFERIAPVRPPWSRSAPLVAGGRALLR
jgi:tRNA(Ile)-lysidine synthase